MILQKAVKIVQNMTKLAVFKPLQLTRKLILVIYLLPCELVELLFNRARLREGERDFRQPTHCKI